MIANKIILAFFVAIYFIAMVIVFIIPEIKEYIADRKSGYKVPFDFDMVYVTIITTLFFGGVFYLMPTNCL